MTWPPDPTYVPPGPTDCSGGQAAGGLSTGDRLAQVPVGRLVAAKEIGRQRSPVQAMQKPFTGTVPGPFGGTCRCEQTAQPLGILPGNATDWLGPLGAVVRLSDKRSVWVVCTNGKFWGAVVGHEPFGLGPWQDLVELPPGVYQFGPGPTPISSDVQSPGLAAFGSSRIVIVYEIPLFADTLGSTDKSVTYRTLPFDVHDDGSITPAGSGWATTWFSGGSGGSDPPPHFMGAFRNVSDTVAILSAWNGGAGVGVGGQYGTPPITGIMTLGPGGEVVVTSSSGQGYYGGPGGFYGAADAIWRNIAADHGSGLGFFVTCEKAPGPADSHGVQPHGLYGYVVTTPPTGPGSWHQAVITHRTELVAGVPCFNIHAPVCLLSPNRYLVAVYRTVWGPGPAGFVDLRELLIVHVDGGGITIEQTLPYPDTTYGIDEVQGLVSGNGVLVAFLKTVAPFATKDIVGGTIENHHGFGLMTVFPDKVTVDAGWTPDPRAVTYPGPIVATEWDFIDPLKLVLNVAQPGVASAAWNVPTPVNPPAPPDPHEWDPLYMDPIYEPEAELCLLTGFPGTPAVQAAGGRLSPRGS